MRIEEEKMDQMLLLNDQEVMMPIDLQMMMMPVDMAIAVPDMTLLVDGWDVEMLNTAKNAPNFTEAEKEVIFRMNQARTNPNLFKTQFVEPMLARFQGNIYVMPDGTRFQTNEGPAAVQECIRFLQNAQAVPPLQPSQVLHQSATAHAQDSSRTGIVGHDSSDGTSFENRLRSYSRANNIGENISYGLSNPLDIVVGLMVDDGVSSRGHRENIMRSTFTHAGVGIATHPTYRSLCVIDYGDSDQ